MTLIPNTHGPKNARHHERRCEGSCCSWVCAPLPASSEAVTGDSRGSEEASFGASNSGIRAGAYCTYTHPPRASAWDQRWSLKGADVIATQESAASHPLGHYQSFSL